MEQSSPREAVEGLHERLSSELHDSTKQCPDESLHKCKQRHKSTADHTGAAAEDCKFDPSSRAAKTSPQVMGRHFTKHLTSSFTTHVYAVEVSKDTGVRRHLESLGDAHELAVTWKPGQLQYVTRPSASTSEDKVVFFTRRKEEDHY